MIILFLGGALGGIAGVVGFMTNAKIFRTNLNGLAKFALTAVISVLVGVAYLVVAAILLSVIHLPM